MLLKHLVSINNTSGDHNGITQIVQDKKQKVYKNTMGGLVSQFQKDYDSEVENNVIAQPSKINTRSAKVTE
jgi:hypothetical protein